MKNTKYSPETGGGNAAEGGITAGHLTMLALGTVIGGSFFLGSSVAINAAGPAILLAYIFGGILVYYLLYAMSEMSVAYPDYGGFRTFAAKAFGERGGFRRRLDLLGRHGAWDVQ